MREYGMMIFGVAAVISVCGFAAYKGGKDIAVRFALAVLLVYTVITPITRLISGESGAPSFDYEFDPDGYDADYIDVARDAFCLGIENAVCAEFSLESGDVRTSVVGFDFETMSAERIRVTLSGAAVFADYKGIENYVNSLGVGRCDAEIEIG